jgi:hypothetical protein
MADTEIKHSYGDARCTFLTLDGQRCRNDADLIMAKSSLCSEHLGAVKDNRKGVSQNVEDLLSREEWVEREQQVRDLE